MMNLRVKILFLLILLIITSSSLALANIGSETSIELGARVRGFHEPLFTSIIRHYQGDFVIGTASDLNVIVERDLLVNRSLFSTAASIGIASISNNALHVRLTGTGDYVVVTRESPGTGALMDLYGSTTERLRIKHSEQDIYEIKSEPTGSSGGKSHMVLNPGGNVGIGTDSPTEQLDVHGETRISGQLDMDGRRIINVGNAEYSSELVNKEYVDDMIQQLGSLWDYQSGSTSNIERTSGDVIVSNKLGINLNDLNVQERVHVGGDIRVDGGSYVVGSDKGITGKISYIKDGEECEMSFTEGIITSVDVCEAPCQPLTCNDLNDLAFENNGNNCGLNLNNGCEGTINCYDNCGTGNVCTYDHAVLEFIHEDDPQKGYCDHDNGCNPVIPVEGVSDAGRQFCISLISESAIDVCTSESLLDGTTAAVTKLNDDCYAGSEYCAGFFDPPISWIQGGDYLAITENGIDKGDYYIEIDDTSFTPKECPVPTPPSIDEIDEEFTATSTGREGTIQTWTVPVTGTYKITAQGAGYGHYPSQRGAMMSGNFYLIKGQVLEILVGQMGQTEHAGSGGTFVVKAGATTNEDILVIAGGAGGGSGEHSVLQGWTNEEGQTSSDGRAGGTDGDGGVRALSCYGQSGAGVFGDGDGCDTADAKSFLNNGLGALGSTIQGGYGGGGTGRHSGRLGGGGGYSGGGAARYSGHAGGGGGSFNAGSDQDNESGFREGHGLVIIEGISSSTGPSDPEQE